MAPSPVHELPAELAERLLRLVETETAGSRPWPGVDHALRRDRHRRLTGLSAVTAVGILLGAVAYADLAGPARSSQPASPSRSVQRQGLAQLRAGGYGGPAGGSLAGDAGWLKQVRERARELAAALPTEEQGRVELDSADDVLVPWAGMIDGTRYALVVYSGTPGSTSSQFPGGAVQPAFVAAVLAGDRADRLTIATSTAWAEVTEGRITSGQVLTVLPADPAGAGTTLTFVTGPTVTGVKVAAERHFSAAGKLTTRWRALARQGSVAWVGELTPAETYMSDLQIDGVNGYASTGPDPSPVRARMRGIAPAGVVPGALNCASDETTRVGGSIVDQPVLAATTPVSKNVTFAAGVLRSPDGPWLVAFCQQVVSGSGGREYSSNSLGAVFPAPTDPATFLGVVENPDRSAEDGPGGYLVVAPAAARTVTMGTETALVQDRLAWFRYNDDRTGTRTVQARDAIGAVIATARSRLGR